MSEESEDDMEMGGYGSDSGGDTDEEVSFNPFFFFSVADSGCLSRTRIFSIPDPGSELFPS
jgi:hypothetical protein